MKLRRSLVGCGRTEYLFQLAGRLLACWPLDTVDRGIALPCFGIDSEVDFRHIVSLIQNFTLILIVFPTRSLMRMPPSFLAIFRAAAS